MIPTAPVHQRLFRQRRFRQLLGIFILIALVLGIAIVPMEAGSSGKIDNLFDGLYWSVTTLSGVGYGDYVPVTFGGKIIAMVLQLVGTAMVGIIIAMVSTSMTRMQDEFYWNRLFERLNRMESDLHDQRKQVGFIVKNCDDSGSQTQTTKPEVQ